MKFRSSLLAGVLATSLSLGGGAALAQDSSPQASPQVFESEPVSVDLTDVDGRVVASATFTQTDSGLNIVVQSTSEGDGSGLEAGLHGIHIHETGVCDPEGETPFESAGGHFNPTGAPHGALEDEESHAGDLGNLEVDETGTFGLDIVTDKLTMEPGGENSLADADGSAIIIHAGEDDLQTDPSGESGDRLACGVIFAEEGSGATPAADGSDATPEATPEISGTPAT
jgi:Cu-Zn family superoxide dismutase